MMRSLHVRSEGDSRDESAMSAAEATGKSGAWTEFPLAASRTVALPGKAGFIREAVLKNGMTGLNMKQKIGQKKRKGTTL